MSYAYYARLEQGYGETMSTEVMAAVAHALRLAEEERDPLIRLAQPDRNRTPLSSSVTVRQRDGGAGWRRHLAADEGAGVRGGGWL